MHDFQCYINEKAHREKAALLRSTHFNLIYVPSQYIVVGIVVVVITVVLSTVKS